MIVLIFVLKYAMWFMVFLLSVDYLSKKLR